MSNQSGRNVVSDVERNCHLRPASVDSVHLNKSLSSLSSLSSLTSSSILRTSPLVGEECLDHFRDGQVELEAEVFLEGNIDSMADIFLEFP